MTEKDEAGVYGFQKPRDFRTISNPRTERKHSKEAEDYYADRAEIAKKIRQATPRKSVSRGQKQIKIKSRKPNNRGTNLSTASTDTGASYTSLMSESDFSFSESESESGRSDNGRSFGSTYSKIGIKTKRRNRNKRRPSLSNKVGQDEFPYQGEEHNAGYTTDGGDVPDVQLELEGNDDTLAEALVSLKIVAPAETKADLQSSYKVLMSGNINLHDLDDNETDLDDEESELKKEQDALQFGHIGRKKTPVVAKEESDEEEEEVVGKLGIKPQKINYKSRRLQKLNRTFDHSYSQDLSPEILEMSLKNIEEGGKEKETADYGNRKLRIKGRKSRGRSKKRKSNISLSGTQKCVIC